MYDQYTRPIRIIGYNMKKTILSQELLAAREAVIGANDISSRASGAAYTVLSNVKLGMRNDPLATFKALAIIVTSNNFAFGDGHYSFGDRPRIAQQAIVQNALKLAQSE